MGWGSGSYVANELWGKLRPMLEAERRREAAIAVVEALDGQDWDTHDEAPLLIADAGQADWAARGDFECYLCNNKASWWGRSQLGRTREACHNCVDNLDNPVMI